MVPRWSPGVPDGLQRSQMVPRWSPEVPEVPKTDNFFEWIPVSLIKPLNAKHRPIQESAGTTHKGGSTAQAETGQGESGEKWWLRPWPHHQSDGYLRKMQVHPTDVQLFCCVLHLWRQGGRCYFELVRKVHIYIYIYIYISAGPLEPRGCEGYV